jgi:hypothetical protein
MLLLYFGDGIFGCYKYHELWNRSFVRRAWCDSVSAVGRLPPFIGQVEAITGVPHSEMCSGRVPANRAPGGTVILANPCTWHGLMASFSFRGHCGDFCPCRGVASRDSFDRVRAWSSSVHPSRVFPCPFEGLIMGESLGVSGTGAGVVLSRPH